MFNHGDLLKFPTNLPFPLMGSINIFPLISYRDSILNIGKFISISKDWFLILALQKFIITQKFLFLTSILINTFNQIYIVLMDVLYLLFNLKLYYIFK